MVHIGQSINTRSKIQQNTEVHNFSNLVLTGLDIIHYPLELSIASSYTWLSSPGSKQSMNTSLTSRLVQPVPDLQHYLFIQTNFPICENFHQILQMNSQSVSSHALLMTGIHMFVMHRNKSSFIPSPSPLNADAMLIHV